MNKEALIVHDIYDKLIGFSEQDLDTIVSFIEFMRHKKRLGDKKLLKLEGILEGYNIDFSELKQSRDQTWQHVEQEFGDE